MRRRVIKCILAVSRIVALWTITAIDSTATLVTTSNAAAVITITTIRIGSVTRITVLETTRSEAHGNSVGSGRDQ